MGIAKVTRNYQVTIPKDIRSIQGINIGDIVLFAIEGKRIDFFKIDKKISLKELAGTWKDKFEGRSIDYIRDMRKSWKKRLNRLEK